MISQETIENVTETTNKLIDKRGYSEHVKPEQVELVLEGLRILQRAIALLDAIDEN